MQPEHDSGFSNRYFDFKSSVISAMLFPAEAYGVPPYVIISHSNMPNDHLQKKEQQKKLSIKFYMKSGGIGISTNTSDLVEKLCFKRASGAIHLIGSLSLISVLQYLCSLIFTDKPKFAIFTNCLSHTNTLRVARSEWTH